MSYTYLLEGGAESSAECFSDIVRSAPLRSNRTAETSCSSVNAMESCPGSRSGTTCEHSQGMSGEVEPTSSVAASPARTSVSPGREPGSTASGPVSGGKWPGSFAKWDRDTSSWKTPQLSLLGGSVEFSATWPKWGTTVGGVAYRRKTPSGLEAHRQWITSAKESGSSESIGTPTTCHTGRSEEFRKGRRPTPQEIAEQATISLPTPGAAKANNDVGLQCSGDGRKKPNKLGWAVATLTVHTPSANEPGIKAERLVTKDGEPGKIGQRAYDKHTGRLCQVGLSQQVQLMQRVPTPHGFSKDGKSNGPSGNELGRAVNQMQRVPTPAAQDAKNSTLPPSLGGRDSVPGFMIRDGQTGGSLNPSWVEWLMGWPIGWTDSKPLETDKYQQWLHSHGSC